MWDALTRKKAARFPFPVHGRIPNFKGAEKAAQRLLAHPLFDGVKVIKVNPDSPQRWVRKLALERGGKWGEDLALQELPQVDLVVMGSVAVTRGGQRLGKGHGYADLEYAMLRELGNDAVPVATTVHPLQLLDAFPTEAHDLPVLLIATPDELIEVKHPAAPPEGIDWDLLPQAALDEMPVLAELRRLLASKSKAKPGRRARPSRRMPAPQTARRALRRRG